MVVWAYTDDLHVPSTEEDIAYELLEDDSIVIEENCLSLEMHVGERDHERGDLYKCWIVSYAGVPEFFNLNGIYAGRGCYIVEKLTVGVLKKTIREIEEKVNNTWGRDWDEVFIKLSWFARGEWDFVYEADEPVLNPDGTINYDPDAYMYHEDLTFEEYFNKYSPDTPPEIVQTLKEEARNNEAIEAAKKAAMKAAHDEHLN